MRNHICSHLWNTWYVSLTDFLLENYLHNWHPIRNLLNSITIKACYSLTVFYYQLSIVYSWNSYSQYKTYYRQIRKHRKTRETRIIYLLFVSVVLKYHIVRYTLWTEIGSKHLFKFIFLGAEEGLVLHYTFEWLLWKQEEPRRENRESKILLHETLHNFILFFIYHKHPH